MTPLVEIRGLRAYFGEDGRVVKAIDGVDLTVREREVVGLVGESGSGKTTVANCLLRILPPTGRIVSGVILFKGEDLLSLSERQMQHGIRGKEISMIFQDPMVALNPLFTAGEQVTSVLRLHQRMRGRRARAEAIQLFRRVGLSDPERRFRCYPHELSGGMIQRVTIAMAMSCHPSLVIADEPTTALDVTIASQILREFEELIRVIGVSVLWITHDLGIVRRICDYVNVMYAGTLLEHGTVDEIFRRPLHPYTESLLGCCPARHIPKTRIPVIPGELSSAVTDGCRFAPRCPRRRSHCMTGEVALRAVVPEHSVRCGDSIGDTESERPREACQR